MKTHEEMNREFHRILQESDRKHTDALHRRETKKQQLFALLSGKKPSKDNK